MEEEQTKEEYRIERREKLKAAFGERFYIVRREIALVLYDKKTYLSLRTEMENSLLKAEEFMLKDLELS